MIRAYNVFLAFITLISWALVPALSLLAWIAMLGLAWVFLVVV